MNDISSEFMLIMLAISCGLWLGLTLSFNRALRRGELGVVVIISLVAVMGVYLNSIQTADVIVQELEAFFTKAGEYYLVGIIIWLFIGMIILFRVAKSFIRTRRTISNVRQAKN